MMSMSAHRSVLLQESLTALAIKPEGIYIDGTFGRGGHSRAILSALGPSGRLIAIDKDLDAIAYAQAHFSDDGRFQIVHGSFADLLAICNELNITGRVDGILLDLGVSSPQLDNPERGFSFMHDGPLDMRMDATQDLDAAWFVNHADVSEMARIFKLYGEERFALRIARAIVSAREAAPIETTAQLANIVKDANPKWEKHKHPATRVFQAIRIHINQELSDLTAVLTPCLTALAVGGRLAVISFHSLEDRVVKQFMRDEARGDEPPRGVPIQASDIHVCFKRVGKAVKASEAELQDNNRARSAVLRIGEKIA